MVRKQILGIAILLSSTSCTTSYQSGFHPGIVGSGGVRLALAGPAVSAAGPCGAYTLTLLDASGSPVSSRIPLTVQFSGMGSGGVYTSLDACFIGESIRSTVLPAGTSALTLYLKNELAETNDLFVQATALESGFLPIRFERRPLPLAGGLNGSVSMIALPEDPGRLFMFGMLSRWGETRVNGIVAFDAKGRYDTSFVPGKIFSRDEVIFAVANQPKETEERGIFLVGRTHCAEVTYVDCTKTVVGLLNARNDFEPLQTISAPSKVLAIARDSRPNTSRVYVGGTFTELPSGPVGRIFALNHNGLDVTFNTGTGFDSAPTAIAVSSTGDVVVRGAFTQYNGIALPRLGWAKLSLGGALDLAFQPPAELSQSHGILVRDPVRELLYVGRPSGNTYLLVRIDFVTGATDATFNIGSGFQSSDPFNISLSQIVPTDDGKLYVFGKFETFRGAPVSRRLLRLNGDGTLDSGFEAAVESESFVLDPGGSNKLIVALPEVGPIRLNLDGSLDTTYGLGTLPALPGPSGRHGVVTGILTNGETTIGIGEFQNKGSLKDKSAFVIGNDNVTRPISASVGMEPHNGAWRPGGSEDFYLAGRTGIARFRRNGDADSTFFVESPPQQFTSNLVVLTQSEAPKRVLVGNFRNLGITEVRSYLDDAKPDPAFSTGLVGNGVVTTLEDARMGNGSFYVGGNFNNYSGTPAHSLARVRADGTLDPSFVASFVGFAIVESIALAQDGSGDLVVVGVISGYAGVSVRNIVRLTAQGGYVSGFQQGSGPDGAVKRIAATTDGSGDFYVAGDFLSWDGQNAEYLVRISAGGKVVPSFRGLIGLNGVPNVLKIVPDGSGRLLVGGAFSSFNRTTGPLIRLTGFGELD